MSALYNIQNQYSIFESWFYDNFIASGTLDSKTSVLMSKIQNLPHGAKILDIGCGGCQVIVEILKSRPDLNFTAIDNSIEQIQKAQKRIDTSSIVLLEASAMCLPFENENFDFVYSLASLKHWPNKKLGLSEALRVLKKNQFLLITELDRTSSLDRVVDFISRWKTPRVFRRLIAKFYWEKIIKNSLCASDVVNIFATLSAQDIQHFPFPNAPAFVVTGQK